MPNENTPAATPATTATTAASRRDFLRKAGLAAIVAPVAASTLAACTEAKAGATQDAANASGGTMPGHGTPTPTPTTAKSFATMTLAEKRARAEANRPGCPAQTAVETVVLALTPRGA